jgi:glutathione S-transferase
LRNLSPGFKDRVFPGPENYAQIPELIERGRRRSEQFFDRTEERLNESRYLAGDAFSFADISLLAAADFAGWIDINATTGRPAVERWYNEVTARPSANA